MGCSQSTQSIKDSAAPQQREQTSSDPPPYTKIETDEPAQSATSGSLQDGSWYKDGKVVWKRNVRENGSSWIEYGFSDQENVKTPSPTFICKMILFPHPTYQHHNFRNRHCKDVVKRLAKHRKINRCQCDFVYIRCGRTSQEATNLCLRTNETDENPGSMSGVENAMARHDSDCLCGCFFEGVLVNPWVRRTPGV